MKPIHLPYMKTFIQFAQADFETRSSIKTISGFALLLTGGANQIIKSAEFNSSIDLPELRKELFEAGCLFIRKFGDRGREEAEMNA